MKKLLKLLKQIKEIKKLDKNDFHVFRVDADTDFQTMGYLSELLDKQNIKHVIVRNDFYVKNIRASDKKDLFNYIKKEIGLEEPETIDNLKVYQDCTIDVELSTKTDTKIQYNDLIIEYDSVTNVVLISYDLDDGKHNRYVLPVKEKGKPVYFKYKINFGWPGENEIFDMDNITFEGRK